MSVDPQVIEYIADLAKLELEDDERAALAADLARIVGLVEQLGEVDVEDVPPTKHVIEQTNVTRPDRPRPGLSQREALDNAPDADEGHFLVPRVLPD